MANPAQAPLVALRNKILFVIGAIIVYRIGAHVPVPGIDPVKLHDFFSGQGSTILDLFNMFSGGALTRFTVFALGIMPYISASIITQMLTIVSPALSELKKQGEVGRRKINQYTRMATVGLALFQSIGLAKFLAGAGVALMSGFPFYFVVCTTLITGTMFLMWLGEQMTERGIGNGISLIIFAGIAAGFPGAIGKVLMMTREGEMSILSLIFLAVAVVAVTAFVVFVERGQRRITVNYAKRQHGHKVYAAQTTHLPLKVNMAGVIPPIFASSILLFPATVTQFFSGTKNGFLSSLTLMLSPGQPLYIGLFLVAIIFFAFFYTALVYNPEETADTLKKSGAFIPGMRPGEQTARYIDTVMTRLTLIGALYLAFVCLLPQFLVLAWSVPFVFGGTSLLIVVVVVMDMMQQVQTHLMSYQYESLMKKVQPK
ncbi:MAG: preprotein translocase subunit SecY [Gammaproteobacteria bacterium]